MRTPDEAAKRDLARPAENSGTSPTTGAESSAEKANVLFATLPFWVMLPILAYALSYVVTRGESFGDVRILFLQAKPRILLIGLVLAMIYGVLLTILLRRLTTSRLIVVLNTVPVMICAVGLVLASLSPGSHQTCWQDFAPTLAPLSTKRYVVPVLFPTGSHELTATERERLREAIKIFMPCGVSELKSVGFASSTPYKLSLVDDSGVCDSDCRNLRLANLRARSVEKFVWAEFKLKVESIYWNMPAMMTTSRRLADMNNGRIDWENERLNRRAELSWTPSGCW